MQRVASQQHASLAAFQQPNANPAASSQLQQTGRRLTSRLHLATIDRFHAVHSRASILSSEDISTWEHLKIKKQATPCSNVQVLFSSELLTGPKQDEKASVDCIYT